MNERIQELANQILPYEKEFNKGDPKDWGYFFSAEELEDFAKLIIRECCDIFVELRTRPADLAVKDVKKHFGVEE